MSEAELEAIRNYRRLEPDLASAGQPEADQLELLPEHFDCVINLARSDSPHALADEAERIAGLGLDYVHIPVDFKNPRTEDLERFFAAMQTYNAKRRLVHCALNWRASAFVFLHRVINEGHDPGRARSELHAVWQPDTTWQAFIDHMLQQHGSPPGE